MMHSTTSSTQRMRSVGSRGREGSQNRAHQSSPPVNHQPPSAQHQEHASRSTGGTSTTGIAGGVHESNPSGGVDEPLCHQMAMADIQAVDQHLLASEPKKNRAQFQALMTQHIRRLHRDRNARNTGLSGGLLVGSTTRNSTSADRWWRQLFSEVQERGARIEDVVPDVMSIPIRDVPEEPQQGGTGDFPSGASGRTSFTAAGALLAPCGTDADTGGTSAARTLTGRSPAIEMLASAGTTRTTEIPQLQHAPAPVSEQQQILHSEQLQVQQRPLQPPGGVDLDTSWSSIASSDILDAPGQGCSSQAHQVNKGRGGCRAGEAAQHTTAGFTIYKGSADTQGACGPSEQIGPSGLSGALENLDNVHMLKVKKPENHYHTASTREQQAQHQQHQATIRLNSEEDPRLRGRFPLKTVAQLILRRCATAGIVPHDQVGPGSFTTGLVGDVDGGQDGPGSQMNVVMNSSCT
ncbi:unnamed protein product [Amoebophrya sp. A25]|nr:unnamed protein product [Amoebophrya sp. A25]|eukprot:GSA25T00020967001.1